MLWRNRQILPFSSRLLFYNSYILSKIDYCLPIWGNSAKNGLDKIWRLQKRAVRIVCNVPYDTPSSDLFKQLKSMNIYERYFYQVSLNVYKILSLEDSPLKCLVNLQSPSCFYSLRSSSSQFTLNVLSLIKRFLSNHFLILLQFYGTLYHLILELLYL